MSSILGKSFIANLYYSSPEGDRPIDYDYSSLSLGDAWVEAREKSGRSKLRPLLDFKFTFKATEGLRHFYTITTILDGGKDESYLGTSLKGYLKFYFPIVVPRLHEEWKIELLETMEDQHFTFWLRDPAGYRVGCSAEADGNGATKDYLSLYGKDIITFRVKWVRPI